MFLEYMIDTEVAVPEGDPADSQEWVRKLDDDLTTTYGGQGITTSLLESVNTDVQAAITSARDLFPTQFNGLTALAYQDPDDSAKFNVVFFGAAEIENLKKAIRIKLFPREINNPDDPIRPTSTERLNIREKSIMLNMKVPETHLPNIAAAFGITADDY